MRMCNNTYASYIKLFVEVVGLKLIFSYDLKNMLISSLDKMPHLILEKSITQNISIYQRIIFLCLMDNTTKQNMIEQNTKISHA